MSSGHPGRLLVVVGPTGTGKSALALELARRLDGEIVGCDALQVYRGFDAGTAKPTREERREVPHHLVDCVEPDRDYTLADYVADAEVAVADILARGRVPIVVGGTGMYLRGLLRGIIEAPPRDPELRQRLRAIADRGGLRHLHRWLRRFDPESAGRIGVADVQRVVRAIEIARSSERSWSDRLDTASWSETPDRYRSLKIGLDREPADLAALLERRVDAFFDAGLVGEVRGLLEAGVPAGANAFKAIGYREVLAALRDDRPVDGCRAEARRKTRRYAKRQRSWFRGEPDVIWLDAALEVRQLSGCVERLWGEASP